MIGVALCYEFGLGTTVYKEKAFNWHLKAAEAGNSTGQNAVAYD